MTVPAREMTFDDLADEVRDPEHLPLATIVDGELDADPEGPWLTAC